MFDTIILVTEPVEQDVLASVLRGHNPRLNFRFVESPADLAAIESDVLRRARLIGFTTNVIVPQTVLTQLGYGAYNFHPGPPHYPGWAPAHFALYDRAVEFGATFHVMVECVDAGPIVDVARFAMAADLSVTGLEELAYAHLAQLFWRWAKPLANSAAPLPEGPVRWSGKRNSRRRHEAICDIPVSIPKDELERRIKAFGASHFGIAPTVHLHGIPFRAVLPESIDG